MAGIKQVYSTPDTFRFPEWDEYLSYPATSVVTVYDSDSDYEGYRVYMALKPTEAGKRPGNDDSEDYWVLFAVDSDSVLQTVTKVFNDNLQILYDLVLVHVDSELAVFDSEIQKKIDSEFLSFKTYFDSEHKLMMADIDSDHLQMMRRMTDQDSDIAALYLKYYYGRIYPQVNSVSDVKRTRLAALWQAVSNTQKTMCDVDFYDATLDANNPVRIVTTSAKSFANGMQRSPDGDHIVEDNVNEETISFTFSNSASYFSEIAFKGAIGPIYNNYFTSADLTINYGDGTTANLQRVYAVTNNFSEIVFVNPDKTKPVANMVLRAYNPSGTNAGVNYIRINSVYNTPYYATEHASYAYVSNVDQLLKYDPHSDVMMLVRDTNTLWIAADSEWVASTPNYKYVMTSIEELERLFPAMQQIPGTRAKINANGFEYFVKNNVWEFDPWSDPAFDSDRWARFDSDVAVMYSNQRDVDSDINAIRIAFDPNRISHLEDHHDSDFKLVFNALNSFYEDYVNLKKEHIDHDILTNDRLNAITTTFNNLQLLYSTTVNQMKADNDSDRNAIDFKITEAINVDLEDLRNNQDSDFHHVKERILAAFLDISLLRNGQVADNDSDIKDIKVQQINQDSDIDYITKTAMKFRGLRDLTTSGPDLNVSEGDCYLVEKTGWTINTGWGVLDSEWIQSGTLVIYRDSEWSVVGNVEGAGGNGQTNGFPAGTILSFAQESAIPTSFHICDGSYFDPGLYSELFDILGTNQLPDLRGYFLRGWSDDNLVDPDGPRAGLSIQQDAMLRHRHIYQDLYAGGLDGVLNGSTDDALDDVLSRDMYTDYQGTATETRPKNVAVYYAIAMYTGAGVHSTAMGDSDIRVKTLDMESDMLTLKLWKDDVDSDYEFLKLFIDSEIKVMRRDLDSDTSYFKQKYLDRESDFEQLNIRMDDHDSDMLAFNEYRQFAQVTAQRNVVSAGNLIAQQAAEITSLVFPAALNPEPYNYPIIKFYFSTQGSTINNIKKGREMNGQFGTPFVSSYVAHDAVGGTRVYMQADSEIRYDIHIVSSFRTN